MIWSKNQKNEAINRLRFFELIRIAREIQSVHGINRTIDSAIKIHLEYFLNFKLD